MCKQSKNDKNVLLSKLIYSSFSHQKSFYFYYCYYYYFYILFREQKKKNQPSISIVPIYQL